MGDDKLQAVLDLVQMRTLRTAEEIRWKRAQVTTPSDGGEIERFEMEQVRPLVESVTRLTPDTQQMRWVRMGKIGANIENNSEGRCVQTRLTIGRNEESWRRAKRKGPVRGSGYD